MAEQSGLSLEQLWQHSLQTGTGVRALARDEKWSTERADEAFLAGVLHDLGKLVLATRPALAPEVTDIALNGTPQPWDESHAEAGAYLLGLWGFSDVLVEAIAFHHKPSEAPGAELGLAGLLHVADRLAHGSGDDSGADIGIEPGYLESVGLTGRLSHWQEVWNKSS